jgi:hypothetical protein
MTKFDTDIYIDRDLKEGVPRKYEPLIYSPKWDWDIQYCPSSNKKSKCDCGAEKCKTTHADWCSLLKFLKESKGE